jgi:hypothetical protein
MMQNKVTFLLPTIRYLILIACEGNSLMLTDFWTFAAFFQKAAGY